jgi:hypothetical protein
VYSHMSFPWTEAFTLDTAAPDSRYNTCFDPDMLPDEGISPG